MKNVARIWILIGFFVVTLNGKAAEDDSKSGISCRTSLRHDSAIGYAIHIVIQNTGPHEVVFFQDYLPWRSPLLCKVVAIPLGVSESPVLPITKSVDPTLNQLTIKPGSQLEGDIVLNKDFEKFDQLIFRKEVGIFWSFTLENVESERYGRYSGFFVISPPGSQ